MDDEVIENFFGVYMLYCMNPLYKGRTYIGFTVDPNRRIKQHNLGIKSGGAYRTNNKGPWKMVLIIHGFPNDISALRFEWAWTYPHRSRRLNFIPKKKAKETKFHYNLRVMSHMLRTNPWSRLPLTIRWLEQEFQCDFQSGLDPPIHMPVAYGPIKSNNVKAKHQEKEELSVMSVCSICRKHVDNHSIMRCLERSCNMCCHVVCLSERRIIREFRSMLPIEVICPCCKTTLLWGDLVQLKKGCHKMVLDEQAEHWSDILTQTK